MAAPASNKPPIVMVNHPWDDVPMKLGGKLLSFLREMEYRHICLEVFEECSEENIIKSYRSSLAEGVRVIGAVKRTFSNVQASRKYHEPDDKQILERILACENLYDATLADLEKMILHYYSSKGSVRFAEVIKACRGGLALSTILAKARAIGFSILGIDDASLNEALSESEQKLSDPKTEDAVDRIAGAFSRTVDAFDRIKDARIRTMVRNISQLVSENKGVFFFCSVDNAEGLIEGLKGKSIQPLVYFPYSAEGMFDPSLHDLKDAANRPPLKGHSFFIPDGKIDALRERVLNDVRAAMEGATQSGEEKKG